MSTHGSETSGEKIGVTLIIIYLIGCIISAIIIFINHPGVKEGLWYKMESVQKVLYITSWIWIGLIVPVIIFFIGLSIYVNVFKNNNGNSVNLI